MSRKVARNAVWNVAGSLISVAVGLVALPILLHALGPARLGLFTLALGLIGLSGVLDLGLGRSLTQGVSSALGRGRPRESVAALVWHVLRLLAGFGLLWLALVWLVVPFVVERVFSLRGELAAETIFGLRAVALSIPFALVATGAMGSLEGLQRFRQVSTLRSAMSVIQFGVPTIVALWRPDVGWVIAGLAASRVLSAGIWALVLHRALPAPRGQHRQSGDMTHLLRFGGWLSVSNVIGPMMANVDRLYLASLLPPASVAAYTVSYDSVFRVTTIPFAAAGAMFPALAEAQSRPERSVQMVRFAVGAVVMLTLPPLLLATIFAKPLLTLWLGQEFALATLPVFQVLIVGAFMSCTAHVPYTLLHAHGRSDITAKIHLIELPLFFGLLVWGVSNWGIVGAAIATTLRVTMDTGAAYACSVRMQASNRSSLIRGAVLVVLGGAALIAPLLSDEPLYLISVGALTLSTCFVAFVRFYMNWRKSNLGAKST